MLFVEIVTMNIKQAKEQIKNTIKAYFSKDEYGNFIIPIQQQRPIFLIGAPGVGKTAIMQQIASELGVGLISYSMTHHTRQSALGLPFIVKKNYGGQEYDVSEYTMSEIIATVYDMIEETGKNEGILFLDEINCVSETLAPAMLQFLQYKIFGRHRVPDGWLIVTAGNPPEYNNSVREFDIVTWDRLKRINVEADYTVWKEYAYNKCAHHAVMTYLDIKKDNFYKIETTVDGKSFVTARGWSDLSDMITLYEKLGIAVDENLIAQYLQNQKIAKDFALYYDLFNKYKSDYQAESILSGNVEQHIKDRASKAKFDERLALLGLLIDAITGEMFGVYNRTKAQTELFSTLRGVKIGLKTSNANVVDLLKKQIADKKKTIGIGKKSSSLSIEMQNVYSETIVALNRCIEMVQEKDPTTNDEAFLIVKNYFDERTKKMNDQAQTVGVRLSNVFKFCEEVFGDGQELLILVTELTVSQYGSYFIGRYGCKEYFAHNKELLFYERQKEIVRELDFLNL